MAMKRVMIWRRNQTSRRLLWCCTIQEHVPGPIYIILRTWFRQSDPFFYVMGVMTNSDLVAKYAKDQVGGAQIGVGLGHSGSLLVYTLGRGRACFLWEWKNYMTGVGK